MLLRRTAILPSALAIGLVLTTPAVALPAGPDLILTYWEAKAAGLPVGATAAEMGLPQCPKTPDPGFASAAEAEATMARVDAKYGERGGPKPPCLADPTTAIYGFGGSSPMEDGWPPSMLERVSQGLGPAEGAVFKGRVQAVLAAWHIAGSPRLASSWFSSP